MERQATQPAAVPSGRKRRRVSSKKPNGNEEAPAPAPDMKATRELEMALNALPRADQQSSRQSSNYRLPTDQYCIRNRHHCLFKALIQQCEMQK